MPFGMAQVIWSCFGAIRQTYVNMVVIGDLMNWSEIETEIYVYFTPSELPILKINTTNS